MAEIDLSAGLVPKQDSGAIDLSAGLVPAAQGLTENTARRGTYDMWDDKGQKQPIPYDKVLQAQQLGYKFDTNPTQTGLTPAQQFIKDQRYDPTRSGGTSFNMGTGKTPEEDLARARQIEANAPLPMQVVGGIAKGGAELMRPASDVFNLAAGVSPQQWSDEIAARGVAQHIAKYGTVGAAAATALPAAWAAPTATIAGLGTGLVGAGAGQIIGPAAGMSPQGTAVLSDVLGLGAGVAGGEGASAAQSALAQRLRLSAGGEGAAAAREVLGLGAGEAGGTTAIPGQAPAGAAGTAGGVGGAGTAGGPTPAPGSREEAAAIAKTLAGKYFPSFVDGPPESLLDRAIKPGKNNVNWLSDVKTAGPLMKSAEQQLGRPIAGIDDALEANVIAKKSVWNQYMQRLGPAAQRGATIDGNQIADAMVNSVNQRTRVQNPALFDRIQATADTYRRPMPLDEAEDFLHSTNADLNSYYAKNKVNRQVAMNDPKTAYKLAEADALRDGLYSKLDDITGPGAAQLKKAYGALTNMQKELSGRQLVFARQQPESLAEQIATAKGAGTIAKGLAKTATVVMAPSGFADIAEGTQNIAMARFLKSRGDANNMIARAFQKLPQAQPFPAPAFRYPQPTWAQPDLTNPAYRLPAQSAAGSKFPMYAPDPGMSEGERVAALMQLLRSRGQLALPAKASAIPLPPPQ